LGWGKEFRQTAVALAAVFCLGSIGYRVLTAPEIPDLAPTVTKLNGTITAASTALQGLPAVLSHVQTTSDAATGVLRSASPVVASFSGTAGKLNDMVDLTSHRINDLCPVPTAVGAALHPCGTLADTNRTLATLRGTSGQVENSLRVFNQHEGDLFAQESAAYAGMNKSVFDFDALVSDPDLKANIHNSAVITGNFAAISTDGKDWLHLKLAPTKTKGFVSGFEATGDVMKHWIPSLF
jgi:hypothetical protein